MNVSPPPVAPGWELGPPEARWPDGIPTFSVDGERMVRPDFVGRGLANVAPTVLRLLGVEAGLPPLAASVLPERLTQGVRAVVLLVADGLGHLQLMREVASGNAPTLARLLESVDERVSYAPITSVFPTTTVAALGSLNSGVAPAEHGLLGYTLYLEELGGVAEMIRWGPLERRGSYVDPALGGASPEAFFDSPTIYRRLRSGGVNAAAAVSPAHFQGTALTRMLHQDATYAGYPAPSSLAVMVPRLLREREGSEPIYLYAYWPTVDHVTHLLGPSSEEHGAEVAMFDRAFELLLDRLPARGDLLLLVTADHGHIATSPAQQVRLNQFPGLVQLLRAYPAGERRATYLYALPGEEARLEGCAREQLGDVAAVLSRAEAERLGLFGPGPLDRRATSRVGDVLLFPRGNLQFSYDLPEEPRIPASERPGPAPSFCGLHGGLTPEEALVPLLALRV